METKISTLPSGLRVATVPMKDVASAAVSIWVNVGARFEEKKINGISHFLEHMAFKGTEKRSAQDIAQAFDDVGGYLNAYTSREQTVYYSKTLKDDVPLSVELFADMLQHSSMDKEELERERGVIIQEIGQTLDTPDDIVFDYHQETAFPDQQLGRAVLGTEEVVKNTSQKDLIDYFRNFYTPERMVISVAGDVEHESFKALVEEHFNLPKTKSVIAKEKGVYKGGEMRTAKELEQLHLVMGFEGVSYNSDDVYAQQLLSTILSGGMASRLFQEIREKRGLAYTISSFTSSYDDGGVFNVYAGTGEDKAEELSTVVIDELLKATHDITEEELVRAKKQHHASLLMERESTLSRAEEASRHLTRYDEIISVEERVKHLDATSKEDVMAMAKRIFTNTPLTLTALGATSQLPTYESLTKKLVA
jgi:predicted Zn-dependent peptidase